MARRIWKAALSGMVMTAGMVYANAEDIAPESAPPRRATVTAQILNVRARPGTVYEVVCRLEEGDIVEVVQDQDGWYGILAPPETEAYCAARLLDAEGRAVADGVRVRAGAGVVFSHYATLAKGEQVVVRGRPEKGWQAIEPPAHSVVWVSAEHVDLAPLDSVAGEEIDADHMSDRPAEQLPGANDLLSPEPTRDTVDFEGPVARIDTEEALSAAAAPEDAEETTDTDDDSEHLAEAPPDDVVPELDPSPDVQGIGPAAHDQPRTADMMPDVPGLPGPTELGVNADFEAASVLPAHEAEEEDGGPALEPLLDPATDTKLDDAPAMVGVLLSLKDRQTAFATHVLGRIEGRHVEPICYLRSAYLDLTEWEYQTVRVYGTEVHYPGWRLPVIVVNGLQLDNP